MFNIHDTEICDFQSCSHSSFEKQPLNVATTEPCPFLLQSLPAFREAGELPACWRSSGVMCREEDGCSGRAEAPKLHRGPRKPHPVRGCRLTVLTCARTVCADLEVLYWKQQKERFAAQRKLQSRMVRTQAGLEDGGSHVGWGLSAAFPQGPPLSLPPEHEEEEEELDALEKERGEEDGEAAGNAGAPRAELLQGPRGF